MRLAFFGTPDFSCPALDALIDAGHEIAAVYAQPPRKAARGQRPRPSPVHELAARHGLDVRTPASLRDPKVHEEFRALGLDAAIVVAYGLILPKPMLEAPRLGCLNIHASLLPRWRGAAPIQRAVMEGDSETGVTIMVMDEGLDTGPELLRKSVPIGETTSAGELHDQLARLGAISVVEALSGLAEGRLQPRAQASEGATYADKLERGEGRLNWQRPAAELARAVRGLNPWPGTWFEHRGERIKVLAATALVGDGPPGTVIDTSPLTVACAEGTLEIEQLQRPGRKPMASAAFLLGTPIDPGTVLE